MIASCGCRVKSYRAKRCPQCGQWFCPACYSEHISSPTVYCLKYSDAPPIPVISFEIPDPMKLRPFLNAAKKVEKDV